MGGQQDSSEAQTTTNDKAVYSMVQQTEQDPSSRASSNAPFPDGDERKFKPVRQLSSFWTIFRFVLDLFLAVPPLLFLIYAFAVLHNEGKPVELHVVQELQDAAKYGPTIFPIVFAAIVGSFLKSFAAWKLERGISVLSLEYLLSCRTVFSTVTTPFSLRAISLLTPLLLALWALSPLGGQAAFRVIGAVPNSLSLPWSFAYLDFNSDMIHRGATSSAGSQVMPMIIGAFSGALLSTGEVKLGSQDAYGNIKIPMVEACKSSGAQPDGDGWYSVFPGSGCNYSSIIGIPSIPTKDTGKANMTFSIETQYMYSNCSVTHAAPWNRTDEYQYLRNSSTLIYTNNLTFGIQPKLLATKYRKEPQKLVFTSFTDLAVTNATCLLYTNYVEASVFCHNTDCKVDRVRASKKAHNDTVLTVLDGMTNSINMPPEMSFFETFVRAADSPWAAQTIAHPYSTPIEYYFTHPESPYNAGTTQAEGSLTTWRGADIYPIGDVVFSQRFSQLLNTFWISSIAPQAVTGSFSKDSNVTAGGYAVQNATGEVTPDFLVLQCHRNWLAILIIASAIMLLAAIVAAVFGLLRRGPDILDRASLFLRDNPHANVPAGSTMEHGFDQARRLKDVRLCLGDVKAGHDRGHVAVGTVDAVTPLYRVRAASRVY